MRRRYWTCGKFANWLRGTTYPLSASHEGWKAIRAEAKARHPFRYWLAEEALDKLQDIVCWVPERLSDVRHYLRNRFITKTHYIKTGLQPGIWHESEEQILYGMFGVLVEFIEVEKAWLDAICSKDVKLPWFWQRFRRPDLGLRHLDWEISLVDEDGRFTQQSESAAEQKALYLWWTKERPARQDPWDLVKGEPITLDDIGSGNLSYDEKYGEMNALEEKYANEDTEMLCRLVKIRSHLWT